MLQLDTMLMHMAYVMLMPVVMFHPLTMLMSMTHFTTKGHVDAHRLYCVVPGHYDVLLYATAKDCVDICGL